MTVERRALATPAATYWMPAATAVLALAAAAALVASLVREDAEPASLGAPLGLRLGMSRSEVVARLQARAAGSLSEGARPAPAMDAALEWAPSGAPAGARLPSYLRLGFHAGLLVALEALLDSSDELAQGPPVEVSWATVRGRTRREDGRTLLKVLARDCTLTAADVAGLLKSAR